MREFFTNYYGTIGQLGHATCKCLKAIIFIAFFKRQLKRKGIDFDSL